MAARHRTRQTGRHGPAHQHWRKQPDAFARLMHAALALAFLGAWLTAEWEGLRAWHIAFGHALAGALLLRIAGSLARPGASLGRWWRTMVGAVRRLRARRAGRSAAGATWRPATWSVAGMAALVCAIVVLVPGCFITGWVLSPLAGASIHAPINASTGQAVLHQWLGTALMVTVAAHVALIAVLGVLRGRCMACDMLPGRGDRPAASGKDRS